MLYHEKHSEGITESEIIWPKYIQYGLGSTSRRHFISARGWDISQSVVNLSHTFRGTSRGPGYSGKVFRLLPVNSRLNRYRMIQRFVAGSRFKVNKTEECDGRSDYEIENFKVPY